MKPFPKMLILVTLSAVTNAVAQPPDLAGFPGDQERHRQHWQEDRLSQLTDYLDFSDSQAAQWQAIVDRHLEVTRSRQQTIHSLREEFLQLADQDDPDFEQVGRIALDLHREMQDLRAGREELIQELETVLTPDQLDRFAAFKSSREKAGPGGRLRDRPRRDNSDRNR